MKQKVPAAGQVRRSQVLTSFGPGSMIDLPERSVMVCGLDQWLGNRERVYEERLELWLRETLARPDLVFYGPPIDSGDETGPRSGIEVVLFPLWFLGQIDKTYTAPDGRIYRTRPLIPAVRRTKGSYLDDDRKVRPVVPVRFVQACERGHISDIDWYSFVRGRSDDNQGDLWLDEGGAGNDFSEIYVRDEKKDNFRRALSEATFRDKPTLGYCKGASPWLGPRVREDCDRHNRLLTRSASNAYFSHTVSAISLPDSDKALRDAVDRVWEDYLKYCENEGDLRKERRKEKVAAALHEFGDAKVWAEVSRRLAGVDAVPKGIRRVEIETLLAQPNAAPEDNPNGDFYARAHPLGPLPAGAVGKVDKLVLVDRLREVKVQMGFSRFEAFNPPVPDEVDLTVDRAPLAEQATWLPAVENRGEGVFYSFSKAAMLKWESAQRNRPRASQLNAGFDLWKRDHPSSKAYFPGLPYILLHSLSHLMITALSLDCGYSASAIRERIYADEAGYGILLYTNTPGAEGSLGGLVEVGRNVGRLLERAMDLGRLCSNDPVCAQHDPADKNERRYLHGAACHGCLLIAETSCERRNDMLDRALIVPTVATPDAAFFTEIG
ncbi:MAG: DUF1998 domain-containing protein [Polyangiaceae bacterium]|nr:DUF1998 domain-containing protein [Polyangiaceae bacterium]